MTKDQERIRVHNVGPNHPTLTHAGFVSYLYECAERWAALDPKQARLVLTKAQKADKHPEKCSVCLKHGLV